MMTVFWDRRGVIMTDFFVKKRKEKGMDRAYFARLISRLREAIDEKRPDMRGRMARILLDNARVHTTPEVCNAMQQNKF